MTKTFVAINDPVHNLIRNVTRRTPLYPRLAAEGFISFEYQVQPDALPDDFYRLAVSHTLQGWGAQTRHSAGGNVTFLDRARVLKQVNYFDAVRLDRRCLRDLRRKLRKFGPGMVATELLCYGTGMLRARNDDPSERIHEYLWSQYGRLQTKREVVFARIRALHRNSMLPARAVGKESFDSTNVIYGDALGEIQQLWDRRADMAFLEQVARSLQAMRRQTEIAAYLNPPMNLDEVMRLHRRAQSRWKTAPANGRALLKRVEFILDHTTVDSNCETVYRWRKPDAESESTLRDQDIPRWGSDRSGFDGWLPGTPAK
jgi:hypothetical protein